MVFVESQYVLPCCQLNIMATFLYPAISPTLPLRLFPRATKGDPKEAKFHPPFSPAVYRRDGNLDKVVTISRQCI